jgi:hypothetical protein
MLCLLLFTSWSTNAQVVLQMEKSGSLRTTKFYPGDQLDIRIEGDKIWHSGNYVDGDVASKRIIFSFGEVHLHEITHIRTPGQRKGGKNAGKMLMTFGAGTILYAPVELIYQDDPNWPFIAVGAASLVTGLILPKLLKPFLKTKIGKRKRLRILDITPPSPLDYQSGV